MPHYVAILIWCSDVPMINSTIGNQFIGLKIEISILVFLFNDNFIAGLEVNYGLAII